MLLDERTRAFIDDGARINTGDGAEDPRQDVYLLALDNTEILSVAGAIGIGQKAGIGIAGDVAILDKETLAWIGVDTRVDAQDTISVLARSNEDIIGFAGTVAAGKTGGRGASAAVHLMDTTTRAYIAGQADDALDADIVAGGNVLISADGRADVLLVGGTLGLGKTAGVGLSATVLTRNDRVEAYVGQNADVTAKGLRDGILVSTGELDANGNREVRSAKGLFVTAISNEELLTVRRHRQEPPAQCQGDRQERRPRRGCGRRRRR